jgi:hypothetical protein
MDPRLTRDLDAARHRARRLVVTMLVLYSSLLVWSYLAMRWTGVAILAPAMLLFGALIVRESRRVIRDADAATHSDDAARAFLRARWELGMRRARVQRITAPLLVVMTWAGIVACGVQGNFFYWFGAIAVGVVVLVGAARAHLALRRAAKRA